MAKVSNSHWSSSASSTVTKKPSRLLATDAASDHEDADKRWYVWLFVGLTTVSKISISSISSAYATEKAGVIDARSITRTRVTALLYTCVSSMDSLFNLTQVGIQIG